MKTFNLFQAHEEQINEVLQDNMKGLLELEMEKLKILKTDYDGILTVIIFKIFNFFNF